MTAQSVSDIVLGYPEKPGYQHLGLYQPTLDAFLLVLGNIQHARCVSNLLSSRYHTMIISLDMAENYQHNLIDNVCCHQWTCKGYPTDAVTHMPDTMDPYLISRLEPAPPTGWSIIEEKQWALFVWHWVRKLDSIKHDCFPFYHQQKFFMQMFDVQNLRLKSNLARWNDMETAIYRVLLFGRNMESTTSCIDGILSEFDAPEYFKV